MTLHSDVLLGGNKLIHDDPTVSNRRRQAMHNKDALSSSSLLAALSLVKMTNGDGSRSHELLLIKH